MKRKFEKNMSSKQKEALELIRKYSPKGFGIKDAYYRVNEENLELLFVVNEKNASLLISYLNSLSAIVEKETRGVKIKSNVYVYDKNKSVEKVAKQENLEKISLSVNFAAACA